MTDLPDLTTTTEADQADEVVVDLTADQVGGGETTNVEDYDVYLYYKQPDGTLKPIGIPRSDVPPGGALIWTLEDGEGARIGPAQPEQLIVKDPPVGFREIRLRFTLDTDAPEDQRATLLRLTERYCVVLQTLRQSPRITTA